MLVVKGFENFRFLDTVSKNTTSILKLQLKQFSKKRVENKSSSKYFQKLPIIQLSNIELSKNGLEMKKNTEISYTC